MDLPAGVSPSRKSTTSSVSNQAEVTSLSSDRAISSDPFRMGQPIARSETSLTVNSRDGWSAEGQARKEDEQAHLATCPPLSTNKKKGQAIGAYPAEIDNRSADTLNYGEEIMTKRKKIARRDADLDARGVDDYTESSASMERAVEGIDAGGMGLAQQEISVSQGREGAHGRHE